MNRAYALLLPGLACILAIALISGCPGPKEPQEVQDPQEVPVPKDVQNPQTDQKLTIMCGGSFRPPLEQLAAEFEAETGVPIELSFGQSEDLLPMVKVGKVGDVFVSHDPYLDYTEEAGALLEGVHVGFVAPVLVVRKGNPAKIHTLEDLARPGVKAALPNPDYSTCGEMLAALLEKKGIKDAVFENAGGAIFRSHSEVGTAIKVGQCDGGVMWNGTANTFKDAVDVVPTPYEYDETIKVWVMGLNYSKDPEGVKTFLDFARREGTRIFSSHGYTK